MGQLDKTSRRVSGASYSPRGNKLSQVRRRVSAGDDDKMIDKISSRSQSPTEYFFICIDSCLGNINIIFSITIGGRKLFQEI